MSQHQYLDEGLRRWIITTARNNHWRVAKWYDLEDLVQDGFLCYSKCADHYKRLGRKRKPSKNDRRNFMALVKRTFENHIHDLASDRTVTAEDIVTNLRRADEEPTTCFERLAKPEPAIAEFVVMLNKAPKELLQLIAILVDDTEQGLQFANLRLRRCHMLVCHRLGLDPKGVDNLDLVRHYFKAQPA